MIAFRSATALSAWLALAGAVWAQPGVAVQLPTVSQFSIGTSVVVPDRGRALVGGQRRVSNGSTAYGPSGGRAFGGAASAGGIDVHVWVHDFAALEPVGSLAGEAPARQVRVPHDGAGGLSVRAAQQRAAARRAASEQEARDLLVRGEAAWRSGRSGAARGYLQLAARKGDAQTRAQAEALLQALPRPGE